MHYKFKRAENLDEETVKDFVIREDKRLSLRSDFLEPLTVEINKISEEMIGVSVISKDFRDEEEELEFDEDALLEEFGEEEFGGFDDDDFYD